MNTKISYGTRSYPSQSNSCLNSLLSLVLSIHHSSHHEHPAH